MLAMLGAGIGLLFAVWARDLLLNVAPALLGVGGGLPVNVDMPLDGTVLAFTFGVALITGVVFGLVPPSFADVEQLTRRVDGIIGHRRGEKLAGHLESFKASAAAVLATPRAWAGVDPNTVTPPTGSRRASRTVPSIHCTDLSRTSTSDMPAWTPSLCP